MKTPNSYVRNYLDSITVLEAIEANQQHINTAIKEHASTHQHELIRAIITGVVRHHETLSHWVNKRTKFKPKDQCLRRLLMIAAFQYQFMQSGRSRDTIFQAAEATTHLNRGWAKHIVYAVLNKLRTEAIPIQKNTPQWLVDKLKEGYTDKEVSQVLQNWNSQPETLCIRSKNRKATQSALKEQGVITQACDLSTAGLHASTKDLQAILDMKDQAIYIQDCIHQHSPTLIPPLGKGARVLDACAAPGGKTIALLETQPNLLIDALELNPSRIDRLKENLRTYHQANIILGNALQTTEWWDGQSYDAIIVDAPCSATGLIQKKPEVKLIQSANNIAKLQITQRKILESLWPLLKKGGVMLYSTCSVLVEENEDVILPFIKTNNATLCPSSTAPQGYKTHLPDRHHSGGFCALIQKK